MLITGKTGIRDAYRDEGVARDYVAERFLSPLGALLHQRQVGVVRQEVRKGPKRILEIAPGPARITTDVLDEARSITLLDASAQMLQQARHRLSQGSSARKASLLQADAFQLPFGEAFDLVYSFRLIRHFEEVDRRRLYAQIASVLRPGGMLVFDAVNVSVAAPVRAASAVGAHVHFDALLTREQLYAELSQAGFQVVGLHGVQYRYRWLTALQVYVAPRSSSAARLAMEIANRSGGEPLEWIVVCRRA